MYPSQKHETDLALFLSLQLESKVCFMLVPVTQQIPCCGLVSLTMCVQRDHTGKMGFNEFKELFAVLNGWKQNFVMVDRDCSGTVEPHEMSQCIANMGEWSLNFCQLRLKSTYFSGQNISQRINNRSLIWSFKIKSYFFYKGSLSQHSCTKRAMWIRLWCNRIFCVMIAQASESALKLWTQSSNATAGQERSTLMTMWPVVWS